MRESTQQPSDDEPAWQQHSKSLCLVVLLGLLLAVSRYLISSNTTCHGVKLSKTSHLGTVTGSGPDTNIAASRSLSRHDRDWGPIGVHHALPEQLTAASGVDVDGPAELVEQHADGTKVFRVGNTRITVEADGGLRFLPDEI